jgi:hypothetical protein
MKIGDYTGHAATATRFFAGAGFVKAGYDIATGNKTSYVGKIVLPKGTEQKVTWQRGLIGGTIATLGVFTIFGKFPSVPRTP